MYVLFLLSNTISCLLTKHDNLTVSNHIGPHDVADNVVLIHPEDKDVICKDLVNSDHWDRKTSFV